MVLWSRLSRLLVRAIFRALFRVRIDGQLPRSGPLLVVANHQGWADGFLLAAAFSLHAPVRLIADRAGNLGVWWRRDLVHTGGQVIPIERMAAGSVRVAFTD